MGKPKKCNHDWKRVEKHLSRDRYHNYYICVYKCSKCKQFREVKDYGKGNDNKLSKGRAK